MEEYTVSVGDKFGKLTVMEAAEPSGTGRKWKCRCECGKEVLAYQSALISGNKKSCGCLKSPDRTGQRFGLLTVLGRSEKRAPRGKRTVPLWECRCDCGAIVYKAMDTLTNPSRCSCQACANRLNAQNTRVYAGFYKGTQISRIKNTAPIGGNESGRRGVSKDKKSGKWKAYIKFRGENISLGFYTKLEDAIKARERAEEKYYQPLLEEAQNQ